MKITARIKTAEDIMQRKGVLFFSTLDGDYSAGMNDLALQNRKIEIFPIHHNKYDYESNDHLYFKKEWLYDIKEEMIEKVNLEVKNITEPKLLEPKLLEITADVYKNAQDEIVLFLAGSNILIMRDYKDYNSNYKFVKTVQLTGELNV